MGSRYVALAVRIDPTGRPRVIDKRHAVVHEESRSKMAAMDCLYKMAGVRACGAWEVTEGGLRDVHSAYAGATARQAVAAQTLLMDELAVIVVGVRKSLEEERARMRDQVHADARQMADDLDFERVKRESEAAAGMRDHRRLADLDPETGRPANLRMHIASSTIRAERHPAGTTRPNATAADLMGFPAVVRPDAGAGVRVAIIGSGNAVRSESDGVNVRPTIDCTGADLGVSDVHGAGTHAVSMLVGWGGVERYTRVVGGVEVVPIRVLDEGTESVPDEWLRLGIDTARRLGCQVIVIQGTAQDELPESAEAIRQAVQAGSLVIAPTGDSTIPGHPARWPASMPEVLAVGCTEPGGDPAWWSCSPGECGVYAVGTDIWGTAAVGQVVQSSGTAVAAIWAAAAAALVYARFHEINGEWPSPPFVASHLSAHAKLPDDIPFEGSIGPCLLDVGEALEAMEALPKVEGQPKPPPPPPELLPSPLVVEYDDSPDGMMKMLAELTTILREHRAVTIRFKPTWNDFADGPPIN